MSCRPLDVESFRNRARLPKGITRRKRGGYDESKKVSRTLLGRSIESCGSLIEATFHQLSPCPSIAHRAIPSIVPPHKGHGQQRVSPSPGESRQAHSSDARSLSRSAYTSGALRACVQVSV